MIEIIRQHFALPTGEKPTKTAVFRVCIEEYYKKLQVER